MTFTELVGPLAEAITGIAEQAVILYSVYLPNHPGKWRLVRRLLALTHVDRRVRGRTKVVRRHGIRWRLSLDDWVQRTVYFYGEWDAHELKYLLDRLDEHTVFLDVGSHFGYYALRVASATKDDARVYAFEPITHNHARLSENIRLNGFCRVKTVRTAVSDREGEAVFALPPGANQGSGHVADSRAASSGTERVALTTIDRFVDSEGLDRVDFIKIDVEGMEIRALTGAAATIARWGPDLIVELNPAALRAQQIEPEQLLQLLWDAGYRTHRATKRGLEPFDLESLRTDPDLIVSYINVICTDHSARLGHG
jgi:FkbM family methyltransferase